MSTLTFETRPCLLLQHVLLVMIALMGVPESVPGLSHLCNAGQNLDCWSSLKAKQLDASDIGSKGTLSDEILFGQDMASRSKPLDNLDVKSILRCLNPRLKLRGGLDQDQINKRQRVKKTDEIGEFMGEGDGKRPAGGDEATRNEEPVSGSRDFEASGDNQNGSAKGEGFRGGESSVGLAMSVPSVDGDPMSGVAKDGEGADSIIDRVKQLSTAAVKLRRQEKENAFVTDKQKMQLEEEKLRLDHEMDGCVSAFKVRMLELLNWRNSPHGSTTPPDHSRGGFACVLLDKEYEVAYRLEPMKNQVDAAAWLAFHMVLEMFGVRAARSVATDRPAAVMGADRAMATNYSHESWNDTAVVKCYQEPTLQAFSKHVLKHRNRLLRRSTGHRGGVVCAGTEEDRRESKILTPRAWFWHRIDVPVLPEKENDTITDADRTRRVRGRELADVLCGQEGGGEVKNPGGETRAVRLLCTVFDLGSSDLASLSRSEWQSGAPEDIPVRVVHDVAQALRCLHACGVAHGDVKMANVMKIGDNFWLGDLPALTRATTKMLTNDPLSSTSLISGKRMMCNDMWGLGLITISLLEGCGPFKRTCEKFKRILPPQNSGPLWIIFAAGFLHTLAYLVPEEEKLTEAARSVRQLIQAPSGRKMIKVISREYREVCRYEGEQAARLVLSHPAAPQVWKQLAYCLDVSNVARNALAMPLPGEPEIEEESEEEFEEADLQW